MHCTCATYFLASGSGGFGDGFGELLLRHTNAIEAKIMDITAKPPPANIIIVDCLCFSCPDVSVGGSSDKIVSSALMRKNIKM